jgi:hypothetical protein
MTLVAEFRDLVPIKDNKHARRHSITHGRLDELYAIIESEEARSYAGSKAAADRLCHTYHLEHGVSVVIGAHLQLLRTARNRTLRDSRDLRSCIAARGSRSQSIAIDRELGTCVVLVRLAKSSKSFEPVHWSLLTIIFVPHEYLRQTLLGPSRLRPGAPPAPSRSLSPAPCLALPRVALLSSQHAQALRGNGPARRAGDAASNAILHRRDPTLARIARLELTRQRLEDETTAFFGAVPPCRSVLLVAGIALSALEV